MSSQTQFASLMAVWAKGAVEKMLMILKVSMCEAEDVRAAEQRLSYKTKQVVGSKKRKSVDGLSGCVCVCVGGGFLRSHTGVFLFIKIKVL